jgi:mono/diheme cytochrome c family protein
MALMSPGSLGLPRAALAAAVASFLSISAPAADPPGPAVPAILPPGERIYRERCASCHGESGQGVEGGYSRPLAGNKSVDQLARFIAKSMPEDDPGTCVGEDAENVARYIFDAFYSPIAQARNRPARIDLARLTVGQYRNAVADLIGGFRAPFRPGEERGLRAEYFNSGRPGNRRVLERTDSLVAFDFGESSPAPDKLDPEGFSARWEGSVIATETGDHEIVIRTDHAARLWLNDLEKPLIDVWVKSGAETDHRGRLFLLEGRAYPLRLEFTSRKQGVQDKKNKRDKPVPAFIELKWRPPKRAVEVIPSRLLLPERAPEVFVVETAFPPDDRSTGYERGTSVSRAWVDAASSAAIETASHVSSHLGELAGARKNDDDREAKVRAFAARLVERAFRRPLSANERRLDVDRWFTGAPDLETAVKRVVLFVLNSPRFLYLDVREGEVDSYAVASRLSFALWDSLPDQELLDAAAAGRLASRDDVVRQAERMVLDIRARAKLGRFFLRWLHVEDASHVAKDGKLFPGFGEELVSDLRTSLDLFIDEVVRSERADFRELLVSSDLHLNGRLAAYYGFDLPAGAPFQKVAASGPPRAGVLSHPYVMASLAYTDVSSPIHRGVFLTRSLLGRPLRPPPEAFTPLAPDLHPNLTTRERVALQTEPEACRPCHARINPLGFALEHFDAAGRYRAEEKGKPIDASGHYDLASGERKAFRGVRELAEFLAGNAETHRAFAAHLFHHMVKQPVVAHGPGTLPRLERVFAAAGFNIRKLCVEIAATSALTGVPGGIEALESASRAGYDASSGRPRGERSF